MFFDPETREALDRMKEGREWERANPENPVCPQCNRRDEPSKIVYPLALDGTLVCGECADNETWLATGCRFGQLDCDHNDCKTDSE